MKHNYIYNNSDIGYMDEEWVNYDPENKTDKVISEDENTLKENEEKLKEV
jgi:hypothetical protein